MNFTKFVSILYLISALVSCTQSIKKNSPKIEPDSIIKIEVIEGYPGTKLEMKKGFKSQFITEYSKAQAAGPTKFGKPYKVIIHYKNDRIDIIFTNGQCFDHNGIYKTEQNIIEDYIIREKKYFFDFDEVDHYSIEIDGIELYDKQYTSTGEKSAKLTESEQLKIDLILKKTPKSIEDTAFVDQLENIEFKKAHIDSSQFEALSEIFRYRHADQHYATKCVAVYRDIFIFKKENKVIGIAKICLSCDKRRIYGSVVNANHFGQNGEYEMLKQLLKE